MSNGWTYVVVRHGDRERVHIAVLNRETQAPVAWDPTPVELEEAAGDLETKIAMIAHSLSLPVLRAEDMPTDQRLVQLDLDPEEWERIQRVSASYQSDVPVQEFEEEDRAQMEDAWRSIAEHHGFVWDSAFPATVTPSERVYVRVGVS